jgi:hypothetical protein
MQISFIRGTGKSLESFHENYFRNFSPVAAITIINSFDSEINIITDSILKDYLKKE